MSHAPADVDDCLDLACQAVDREDYARAIALVRRAHELAPMRPDIKSMLASLLEISCDSSGERLTYREGRAKTSAATDSGDPAAPPQTETFSLGLTSSFGVGEFVRTGPDTRRAPISRDHEEDLDPIGEPDDEPSDFVARVAARLRDERLPSEGTLRCEVPPTPQPVRAPIRPAAAPAIGERATRLERHDDAVEPRPATAMETPPPPPPEPAFSRSTRESHLAPYSGKTFQSSFSRMPGRNLAAALVYSFIIVFMAMAGATSHFRLTRGLAADRVSSQGTSETSPTGSKFRGSPGHTEQEIIRLADDYTRAKRFDDAIRLLTPSGNLGVEASLGAAAKAALARAHEGKATELLQKNLVEASVPHYRKAAELNPESATAKLLLGNALYFCGLAYDRNSKEAKRFFTDALHAVNESLELDRENLQAYERLASVYGALQQTAQARAALDKIVQIAPASPAAARAQDQIRALSMGK